MVNLIELQLINSSFSKFLISFSSSSSIVDQDSINIDRFAATEGWSWSG